MHDKLPQDKNKSDIDYIDGQEDINTILLGENKTLYKQEGSQFKEKGFDFSKFEQAYEQQAASKENTLKTNTSSKRKIFYILIILILFAASTVFGYYKLGSFYNGKEKIVQTEWGKVTLNVPQSEEMVNVLAIGFDKGGYRTDTMMIINFDPKTSNVSLISIPRDTLIGINGKRMKLNAAFGIGKFDTTINAIRKITGLPIHYYVAVDTTGFKNIVDALGGVQFDVPKDMKYYDPYQGLDINLKKGPQFLDGNKAEQLVRYRKYVTGDLEREDVQKKFIKALIEQKINFANISDMSKMKAVYDNLNRYVKTNASFNDAVKYFVSALKIKPDSFKTYTLPGQARNINNISYYIYDKDLTQKMISEIIGQHQYADVSTPEQANIQLFDVDEILSKTQQTSTSQTDKTQTNEENAKENDNKEVGDKLQINDGNDLNEPQDSENYNDKNYNTSQDSDEGNIENLPEKVDGDLDSKTETIIDGITYPEKTKTY